MPLTSKNPVLKEDVLFLNEENNTGCIDWSSGFGNRSFLLTASKADNIFLLYNSVTYQEETDVYHSILI